MEDVTVYASPIFANEGDVMFTLRKGLNDFLHIR